MRMWRWLGWLWVVAALAASGTRTEAAAAPQKTVMAVRAVTGGAGQYLTHMRASGDLAVWAAAATPGGDAAIYGSNLLTGRSFRIAGGAGHKSGPQASDGLVVWEDGRATCHACAHDIYGYDSATGREIAIATGAPDVDRSAPAVSGRRVVWIEQRDGYMAIRGVDLVTGVGFTVAEMTANGGDFYGPPAIDGATVVYSEHHRVPQDATTAKVAYAPQRIYAQTIGGGARRLVGETAALLTEYVVASGRVVWTTAAGGVRAFDLANGQTAAISAGMGDAPAANGTLAVWHETHAGQSGIYGYDFSEGHAFQVAGLPDGAQDVTPTGGSIVWRNTDGAVEIGSVSEAETVAPHQSAAVVQPVPQTSPASHSKGMHAANMAAGWSANGRLRTAGIDALSDPATGAPTFDMITVLDSDLRDPTGVARTDRQRGPLVANALGNFVMQYGTTVMVRLWPTHQPLPVRSNGRANPRGNPAIVAADYVRLARMYSWIADIQTDNEPNLEWNSCAGCAWDTWDGLHRPAYAYSGPYDPRLFDAINQYYVDVWNAVDHAARTYPNKTVRARLAAIRRWTPPLSEYWGTTLSDGSHVYDHMKPMLDTYTYLDYHLYPDPTYHADTLHGGVRNPVWDESFGYAQPHPNPTQPNLSYVQLNILSGSYKTTITEFGWPIGLVNPGCSAPPKTQDDTWPADCAADGQPHRFETDIASVRANNLHVAAAAAVWLVQNGGLDYYANGYAPGAGRSVTLRRWLTQYIAQP